jgi:galactose mutarotase-like enzyme
MIVLERPHLRVEIDPDCGGEIGFAGTPGGANALASYDWPTPVPAAASTSYGTTELDWLSRYRGRWQGLFPNAGAESEVDGIPVAFHGETSLARWEVLERTSDACTIRAASRLPLTITRTIWIDAERPVVRIEEQVENDSPRAVPFLWGHHPAFPAVTGATIDLPRCLVRPEPASPGDLEPRVTAWPAARGTDGGERDLRTVTGERMHRLLYANDLHGGWAALRQPAGTPSVALAWDRDAFPLLWIWLLDGTDEFPWYGRARMLALEPQTAAPFDGLAAAHARGEAHVAEPGERRSAWLTLTLFDGDDAPVRSVDRDGRIEVGG